MNTVKKNIVANFLGNFWQALMMLAFVPLYIKFMGVESYGLVGIFVTLQAMFVLLDMGLSSTMSREMARLSVLSGREQEMRDLVRSLEMIYWCVAIFVGTVIMAIAPFIAHSWLKPGQLSSQTIEQALRIMGLAMAFQWPASFYSGGLMGLQKQVLLNMVNAGISTLRGVGAVLVLWLISPTINAFFTWQIIISVVNTGLLGIFLWNTLPHASQKAAFQKQLIIGIWRFAAGMTGITILVTILTQLDKIILSKMLPLEMFGYYTLAGVVAASLYRFIGPVFFAIYPRFTQLVAGQNQDELKKLYHRSCQFMSVLILPVTAVVAMFSYEILFLWTQNPVTAQKCHLLVSVLICGTALNGLMNIPYALQLANGWTGLTFYFSLVSVIILTPMIIYMTRQYGALGGASCWVILNSGNVLFSIHFMHRRLLPYEKWRWYGTDVALPLGASLLAASILRLMMPVGADKLMLGGYIVMALIITLTAAAFTAPFTRSWIKNRILK